MTTIPVHVDKSCAKHSLLMSALLPPQVIEIKISRQDLFNHASLMLQDSKILGRRTFRQTKKMWLNLSEREGIYLRFTNRNLMAKAAARTEDVTDLSKIVGVGCGLFALTKAFNVNINRFARFDPTDNVMRRMDFEFYVGKRRYFHEAKGTTSEKTASSDRRDIKEQKGSTSAYCRKNGPSMAGRTGSIVIYKKTGAKDISTRVILLDPPSAGDGEATESDELSAVLNYYRNIYSSTHTDYLNSSRISIPTWLSRVMEGLHRGASLPEQAPENINLTARVHELGPNESEYAGTIFDRRLTDRSLRTSVNFDDATRKTPSPYRFVGVAAEVTERIVSCQWNRVLEFSDPNSLEISILGTSILASGVMVRDLPGNELWERESRRAFESLQKALV
jgi:hypothetical protein